MPTRIYVPRDASGKLPRAATSWEPTWPKLKRDRVGWKAITWCDMQNGYVFLTKGALVTVELTHGGKYARIRSTACSVCGIAVIVGKVAWTDLLPAQAPEQAQVRP